MLSLVGGVTSLEWSTSLAAFEITAVQHCKNIWVTSTIFWSFQLHACCLRDMLQTSRDASNLIESLRVVETLLLFVKLGSSCRKSSYMYLATFLPVTYSCIPVV